MAVVDYSGRWKIHNRGGIKYKALYVDTRYLPLAIMRNAYYQHFGICFITEGVYINCVAKCVVISVDDLSISDVELSYGHNVTRPGFAIGVWHRLPSSVPEMDFAVANEEDAIKFYELADDRKSR